MIDKEERNADEEDLMHSAILARHGISYSASSKDDGGKGTRVGRDAADRLLDAMDEQLSDVLLATSTKRDVNEDPGTHPNSRNSFTNRVKSDFTSSSPRVTVTDLMRSGDLQYYPEECHAQPGALSARNTSEICRGRDRRRLNGRNPNVPRSSSISNLSTLCTQDGDRCMRKMKDPSTTPLDSAIPPSDLEHNRMEVQENFTDASEDKGNDPTDRMLEAFTTSRTSGSPLKSLHHTEIQRETRRSDGVTSEESKIDRLSQLSGSNPDQNGLLPSHHQAILRFNTVHRKQQSADAQSVQRKSPKSTSRFAKLTKVQSAQLVSGKEQISAELHSNDISGFRDSLKPMPKSYCDDNVQSDLGGGYHPASSNAMNRLQRLESHIVGIENKKKTSARELKVMEKTMDGHRISLMKLEEKLRQNEVKADDARTEFMVLEFKKDQCRKELETTMKECSEMHEKMKGTQNMGMTSEDVTALMRERDELRARFRRGDASRTSIAERQELERALNVAKDDLFRGRKAAREEVEALEEKLDEAEHKLEMLEVEKDSQVKKLELVISGMERDRSKETKAEERVDAIEAEKRNVYEKLDALTKQLQLKDDEIVSLATESNKLREENRERRGKITELELKVTEQIHLREKLILEAESDVNVLKKDTEQVIASLRQEKECESERLRQEIEKEKVKAISEYQSAHQKECRKLQTVFDKKEHEIEQLRERLCSEEDAKRALGEKLRLDAKEQVRSVVARERFAWEQERQIAEKREEDSRQADFEKVKSRLSSEAEEARNKHKITAELNSRLRTEIEELRLESRKLLQEKLDAVSSAREQERIEHQKDLDQVRAELEELNRVEIDKERSKRAKLEEELRKSKHDKKEAMIKCKDAISNAERSERSLGADVRAECQKMEEIIRSFRTPGQSRNRSSAVASRSGLILSTSNRTTDAAGTVSRLRELSDDIRVTLRDLTSEVETHRCAAQVAQRGRDDTLSNCENLSSSTVESRHLSQQIAELNGHNSQDLKSLLKQLADKDNELRDIQRNMSSWKDVTAKKLAQKFEEELAIQLQRKLGRRRTEHKRQIEMMEDEIAHFVTGSGQPSSGRCGHKVTASSMSPISDPQAKGTVKLLKRLQGRVKHLRVENDLLRSSSQAMGREGFYDFK